MKSLAVNNVCLTFVWFTSNKIQKIPLRRGILEKVHRLILGHSRFPFFGAFSAEWMEVCTLHSQMVCKIFSIKNRRRCLFEKISNLLRATGAGRNRTSVRVAIKFDTWSAKIDRFRREICATFSYQIKTELVVDECKRCRIKVGPIKRTFFCTFFVDRRRQHPPAVSRWHCAMRKKYLRMIWNVPKCFYHSSAMLNLATASRRVNWRKRSG